MNRGGESDGDGGSTLICRSAPFLLFLEKSSKINRFNISVETFKLK